MTKRKTKDARTAAPVEMDFGPKMDAGDLKAIGGSTRIMEHVGNWTEFLHVIDEKFATVVDRLEAALPELMD